MPVCGADATRTDSKFLEDARTAMRNPGAGAGRWLAPAILLLSHQRLPNGHTNDRRHEHRTKCQTPEGAGRKGICHAITQSVPAGSAPSAQAPWPRRKVLFEGLRTTFPCPQRTGLQRPWRLPQRMTTRAQFQGSNNRRRFLDRDQTEITLIRPPSVVAPWGDQHGCVLWRLQHGDGGVPSDFRCPSSCEPIGNRICEWFCRPLETV